MSSSVVDLFDILEESRELFSWEWNLRDMLKSHLLELLKNQNTYQREKGESTGLTLKMRILSFIYDRVIVMHRHNYITTLENYDDIEISDHDGKVKFSWCAFKERMGKADNLDMLFNLPQLFFG